MNIFKKLWFYFNPQVKICLFFTFSLFFINFYWRRYSIRQLEKQLIKYNPLVNPSRKIVKINRNKLIDILYDLKSNFMGVVGSLTSIKNQEFDIELLSRRSDNFEEGGIVNLIEQCESFVLMMYDSFLEEFRFAIKETYKNDIFIQRLWRESYELLVRVIKEEISLERIEYKYIFSDEDIYDFYYTFFLNNSLLLLEEVKRIRGISKTMLLNYLNPNILQFMRRTRNYKAKEVFLRDFFVIKSYKKDFLIQNLELDLLYMSQNNIVFKENMKRLGIVHQNLENLIFSMSENLIITKEQICKLYETIELISDL